MAPNLFDQTTLYTPRVRYSISTTSSAYDNTPTNYTGTYDTGAYDSYTVCIVSKPTEAEIKKRIKKMMDRWCIDSWTQHVFYKPVPKLQPISLRGVRLDGRGWANL